MLCKGVLGKTIKLRMRKMVSCYENRDAFHVHYNVLSNRQNGIGP